MKTAAAEAPAAPATRYVPWYLWSGVAAVTSAIIGAEWDVSWHRSIGRDTFWTPAHMAIYACGVLAGITAAYLIYIASTSEESQLAAASISVVGIGQKWLRGPLGAFLAAWGGVAMLISAPFDNWWHNAYGLDVKIISPPHIVLISGVIAINLGVLLLVLSYMNRVGLHDPSSPQYRQLQMIFLWVGTTALCLQMFLRMEFTFEAALHIALPYIVLSIGLPLWLSMFWTASRHPWANSITSGAYMLFIIALVLILPLFPAQPKLGPVFQPVTHFIPPKFPLLLIAPAAALDYFWQRNRMRSLWLVSLLSGVLFIGILLIVEWPFASFMMTPLARNRFFGADYFAYPERPFSYDVLHRFVPMPSVSGFLLGILAAVLIAALCFRIGFSFGEWMKKVQR